MEHTKNGLTVGPVTEKLYLSLRALETARNYYYLAFDEMGGEQAAADALNERGPLFDAVRDMLERAITDAAPGCGVLDVLPAVADLAAIEAGLVTEADRLTRFRTVADKYRARYDCILIDTPPAVGMLTISALFAADAVIIAVQPQYLAVQGLISLNGIIDKLNAGGATIAETRVLFTQFDKRKGLHRLTVQQVDAAGFRVFRTKIRDNVALGEAPAVGLDIFRYAPRSNGAADYAALADEIQERRPIAHVKHNYASNRK